MPEAWGRQVAVGGYGLALAELDDGGIIASALLTNSQNGVGGVAQEIRIPMNASNVLAYAAGIGIIGRQSH